MSRKQEVKKEELTEFDRKRLEEIKHSCRPVDGTPIIRMAMKLGESGTPEDKEVFKQAFHEGQEASGIKLLERAFIEGLITDAEWIDWRDNLGITACDLSPVLQGVYLKIDKPEKAHEKVVVLTLPVSSIYKNRVMLEKRFGVFIKDPKEALEMIKQENPDEFAKFEAEFNRMEKMKNDGDEQR